MKKLSFLSPSTNVYSVCRVFVSLNVCVSGYHRVHVYRYSGPVGEVFIFLTPDSKGCSFNLFGELVSLIQTERLGSVGPRLSLSLKEDGQDQGK